MPRIANLDRRPGRTAFDLAVPDAGQNRIIVELPLDFEAIRTLDPITVLLRLEQSRDSVNWELVCQNRNPNIQQIEGARNKRGELVNGLWLRNTTGIYRNDVFKAFDLIETEELRNEEDGALYHQIALWPNFRLLVDAYYENENRERIDHAPLVFAADLNFECKKWRKGIRLPIGRRSASLLGSFGGTEAGTQGNGAEITSGTRTGVSGSLIVGIAACWQGSSGSTNLTIDDNQGNTYTEPTGADGEFNTNPRQTHAYNIGGTRTAAQGVQVTLACSGTAGLTVGGAEFDGVDASPTVNSITANTGTGTSATPGSGSPTAAPALGIVVVSYDLNNTTLAPDAWSVGVEVDENNDQQSVALYYNVALSGAQNPSTTIGTSSPWRAMMTFFEESGGSAALTGTATATIAESDIVSGGKTIIATLTDDTFVPSGSSHVAHGTIEWLTSTAAAGTYVVSGLAFQPKAIIFWWTGIASGGADAVTEASDMRRGVGFATSTSDRRAVISYDDDGAATSDCGTCVANDCIAGTLDAAATRDAELDITAFASDGFTLTVDDQLATGNITINWIAFGGDDITVAVVGDFTEPATATTVTPTVTGFTSDGADQVIFFAGAQATAAINSVSAENGGICFGVATGTDAADEWCIAGSVDHASAATDTDGIGGTGKVIAQAPLAGGTAFVTANLTAWGTNSFTITYAGTVVSGRKSAFLAIKGGKWKAGSYTINGNTGSATATVSGLAFAPKGVVIGGCMKTAENAATGSVQDRLGLGWGTSTSSRSTQGVLNEDATASSNVEVNQTAQFDAVLAFPSTAGALQSAYDINAMNSDGFQIIVDTAGGVANEWQGYLAFGGGPYFDDARQAFINGFDSAQSEGTGWDAEVKAKAAVTEVVRTSDTVVTWTLGAQAGYNITAQETITGTIPASILTGGDPLVATPTFTIDPGSGNQTVTPNFISAGTTLFNPTLDIPRTLVPNFITAGTALFEPTLVLNLPVTPDTIAAGTSLFNPTLDIPRTLVPNTIAAGTALFNPTLDIPRTLVPDAIAAGTSVLEPTVNLLLTVIPDFISSATVFQPTVVLELTLVPNTIAAGTSLFNPTVDQSITATPNFIPAGTALFNPTLDIPITLVPGTISAGTTLFNPTLDIPVTLVPNTISSGTTLFNPTLDIPITVVPNAIAAGTTLFEPNVDIQGGPITLVPNFISAGTTLFNPTLDIPITLVPNLITAGTTLFEPTIDQALLITPNFISVGTTLFSPSLDIPITLVPNLLIAGTVVFAPIITGPNAISNPFMGGSYYIFFDDEARLEDSVVVDSVFITPNFIAAGTTIYSPSLDIPRTIIPTFIVSGTVLFEPSVTQPNQIVPDFISAGTSVFSPILVFVGGAINNPFMQGAYYLFFDDEPRMEDSTPAMTVVPDALAAATVVFDPTVGTATTIVPNFITAGTTLFEPNVIVQGGPITLVPNFISAGTLVRSPTLVIPVTLTPNFITSTSQVFQPTLALQYTVVPNFVAATTQLFQPTLAAALTVEPFFFVNPVELDFQTSALVQVTTTADDMRFLSDSLTPLGDSTDFLIGSDLGSVSLIGRWDRFTVPFGSAYVGDPERIMYTLRNSGSITGTLRMRIRGELSLASTVPTSQADFQTRVMTSAFVDFVTTTTNHGAHSLNVTQIVREVMSQSGFSTAGPSTISLVVFENGSDSGTVLNTKTSASIPAGTLGAQLAWFELGPKVRQVLSVQPNFIAAGTQFFGPTMIFGTATISPDFVTSATIVFNPAMLLTRSKGLFDDQIFDEQFVGIF